MTVLPEKPSFPFWQVWCPAPSLPPAWAPYLTRPGSFARMGRCYRRLDNKKKAVWSYSAGWDTLITFLLQASFPGCWLGGRRESESIPHNSTKVYKVEIRQFRKRGSLQVIKHAMQIPKHVVGPSLIICPARTLPLHCVSPRDCAVALLRYLRLLSVTQREKTPEDGSINSSLCSCVMSG